MNLGKGGHEEGLLTWRGDPEAPMNLERKGRRQGWNLGDLEGGKQNYRGRNANLAEWVCWGRVGHRRLRFRFASRG